MNGRTHPFAVTHLIFRGALNIHARTHERTTINSDIFFGCQSEFDIVKMESSRESSGEEGYEEQMLHKHRPTGQVQEEIGDVGGFGSSVDAENVDF